MLRVNSEKFPIFHFSVKGSKIIIRVISVIFKILEKKNPGMHPRYELNEFCRNFQLRARFENQENHF